MKITANSKLKSMLLNISEENILYVTIYLRPEIYANSEVVLGAVEFDNIRKKYQTDVNPERRINGPLSDYGEELEPPIRDEYNAFVEDCKWLIDNSGFVILKQMTSSLLKTM